MSVYTRANQTKKHWATATHENPCPICGHSNRCRIAPDGRAAVCWRNGGKVIQCGGNGNGSKNGNAISYVGKVHRAKSRSNGKAYATADEAIHASGANLRGATLAE